MTSRPGSMTSFDRLIGKWSLTGEATGAIEYRWAEGKHFLIQDVDIKYAGRTIRGVEFIGRISKPGKPKENEVTSRFYSFLDGLTLDYIYEIEEKTLQIWFENKTLNNFMKAEFSEDGLSFSGTWQWPGGGYAFKATRLE